MSDEVIALIVTIAILALLFAWAPFLSFICPPCSRYLAQRRREEETVAKQSIKKPSSVVTIQGS
jgi:hypothetical protein